MKENLRIIGNCDNSEIIACRLINIQSLWSDYNSMRWDIVDMKYVLSLVSDSLDDFCH